MGHLATGRHDGGGPADRGYAARLVVGSYPLTIQADPGGRGRAADRTSSHRPWVLHSRRARSLWTAGSTDEFHVGVHLHGARDRLRLLLHAVCDTAAPRGL